MTQTVDLRTASPKELAQAILKQRASTLLALDSMDPKRWLSPCLATVNPPLWEIGHVAWFQERWCVRESEAGALAPSMLESADRLYHSAKVAHDTRWQLDLLDPKAVRSYLAKVLAMALERLSQLPPNAPELYFHRLSLFHEMMHRESFCFSWQTHGYEAPVDLTFVKNLPPRQWLGIPKGSVELGSGRDTGFVFDNEKWASPVRLPSFRITNRVISNGEYREFVRDGGYEREDLWPADVWKRMKIDGRRGPRYWRVDSDEIQVLRFGRWHGLSDDEALTHVSLFEAEAWCRWSGCRLPTEAEWIHAAQHPDFLWGDVWEWTSSVFAPFHGFCEDPYREYSAPWFHSHQVLKGASFATPRGMRDTRFRNFYEPERNDVFNGFRVVR